MTVLVRGSSFRLFAAFLLLACFWGVAGSPLEARGGGGCFVAGTPITLANGRHLAIERITVGERVRAVTPEGRLVGATVRQVFRFEGRSVFRLTTEHGLSIQATGEHPISIGEGKFRNVADLFERTPVITVTPFLGTDKVLDLRPQPGVHTVYNLEVDEPHTFVAGGLLVHNKGGGGGCFAAGAVISMAGGPDRPIETIRKGEMVLGVATDGRVIPVEVRQVFAFPDRELFELTTAGGRNVLVTAEHPFALGDGRFATVADLATGSRLLLASPTGALDQVTSIRKLTERRTVFNLEVGDPHTFVAHGIVVHNKGGGFSSSGRRGGRPASWLEIILLWTIVLILKFFEWIKGSGSGSGSGSFGGGEIDKILPLSALDAKSGSTRRVIADIARQDAEFACERMEAIAREAFLTLQAAWTTRQYGQMAPLVFPDLARDHERQLASMRRNQETNRIENITVERIEPVQVSYTNNPGQRSFTVVIQAKMSDYYVDDRTGKRIRGNSYPERFQEFWTFQWYQDSYRLREIEQVGDSTALLTPNRVEGLQSGFRQSLDLPPMGKIPSSGKVGQLVDAYSESNPIWDQKTMRERARTTAIALFTAYETGETEALDDLSEPAFLDGFAASLQAAAERGEQREFRNLCVRKVVIALARPANQQHPDEYHARVEMHAQRVTRNGNTVTHEDADLTTFDVLLLFQRSADQFLLTEILKTNGLV